MGAGGEIILTGTEFGAETVAGRILGRGSRIFQTASAARTPSFAEMIQPSFLAFQAVSTKRILFVMAIESESSRRGPSIPDDGPE